MVSNSVIATQEEMKVKNLLQLSSKLLGVGNSWEALMHVTNVNRYFAALFHLSASELWELHMNDIPAKNCNGLPRILGYSLSIFIIILFLCSFWASRLASGYLDNWDLDKYRNEIWRISELDHSLISVTNMELLLLMFLFIHMLIYFIHLNSPYNKYNNICT